MGKKLIFKDADFSENALEVAGNYTDITSLFAFTNGKAWSSNTGELSTSTYFCYASADVSQYAGKTLKIAFCSYTTSGGAISGFGDVAKDSSGTKIESWAFPQNGSTGVSYELYYKEITLPSNIQTLCVSYLQTSKIPAGGLQFACYVKE